MVFAEFKEALNLVGQAPALWIPGVVAGALCALLWILYNISGAFFAARLVIIASLVLLLFVAGALALVKKNATDAGTLVRDGMQYYFKVLLPWVVVFFMLVLAAFLIMVVTALATGGTDMEAAGMLAIIVMVPVLFLTFFCDTAAVFENCKVFESLRRSTLVVAGRSFEVLGFFVVCCVFAFANFFVFAMIWEGLLFDKLQPLATYYDTPGYNETQLAGMMMPHNLIAMIGTDGMWITAAVIFASLIVLVPVLLAYKACFYRKLIGSPVEIRQMTGEYDSKGRWYKY